jgi:hypothetical protein
VNARSESPGEISKFAVGRREGDIARRTTAAMLRNSLVIGNLSLSGCASSHHRVPSLDVFGSYFPAWLLSLSAGVILTIIAAGAGRLMDIRPSGLLALILSVSLILIFSISIWFCFFAS